MIVVCFVLRNESASANHIGKPKWREDKNEHTHTKHTLLLLISHCLSRSPNRTSLAFCVRIYLVNTRTNTCTHNKWFRSLVNEQQPHQWMLGNVERNTRGKESSSSKKNCHKICHFPNLQSVTFEHSKLKRTERRKRNKMYAFMSNSVQVRPSVHTSQPFNGRQIEWMSIFYFS